MTMHRCLLLLATCTLTACSGGSSGPPDLDIIDRSGRTVGTVNGFGSVIVNGVAFDTARATITVDDRSVTETGLTVGQVVTVDGTVDADGISGVANAISSDPSVRGTITAIDAATDTLTVLGSDVVIAADTLLGQGLATLDDLLVRDRIEVYGFDDAGGRIVATFVDRTTDDEFELRGRVAAVDAGASELRINALTVDFSGAAFVGFTGDVSVGDLVEVEGDVLNGDVLVAVRVEREEAGFSADDEGTEVDLQGLVTRFVSVAEFDVAGVTVRTNAATEYKDGDPSNLGLNVGVEVEGAIDSAGVLIADEVEFQNETNMEAEAPVEAVDTTTLTLIGVRLTASAQTRFVDESDAEIREFSLADVEPGDFVKIKAAATGDGGVLTLVKRKSPEDRLILKGPVTSVAAPDLVVVTAEVRTDAGTEFEIGDAGVDSQAFFDAVSPGDSISAKGQSPQPGILTAESVELEQ